MHSAILVVAVGILVIIAYGDVRTRRIPNALSVGIAGLGVVRMTLVHDAVAAGNTLAVGVVIFAAAFVLFWRGAIGGGDAKLTAAMALLIGHREVLGFLFLMSLCGGVLALALLARDKLSPRLMSLWRPGRMPSPIEAAEEGAAPPARSSVPYGVAIAAAGVITLTTAR